jgi:glycosyltransferase involved in cell wall biosynthesis
VKILVAHNYYQQPGGEDTVVERETALLRQAGHSVIDYHRSNTEVESLNWWGKITLPKRIVWASDAVRDLETLIRATQPDLAHFHNTHFMISPAAYQACRDLHTPVVQSLYNPRLMCPAASFYRNGQLCQDCLGKAFPWPGVLHACYRQSRLQTAVLALSLFFHRRRGTWINMVDGYVMATEFYRQLYIAGGLPADKLHVKPHFVMPVPEARAAGPGQYALFVGRLDPEKGARTLLRAWQGLDIPLKIRGDGQLLAEAQQAAQSNPAIEMVGRLSAHDLFDLMRGARFLVWPSEGFYETFGLVAIESFACGTPVIASRIGVMAEIVADGRTGLHFAPGDANDLAAKATWAWGHAGEMSAYGQNARHEYEERYTPERNYEMLMAIYDKVISSAP